MKEIFVVQKDSKIKTKMGLMIFVGIHSFKNKLSEARRIGYASGRQKSQINPHPVTGLKLNTLDLVKLTRTLEVE